MPSDRAHGVAIDPARALARWPLTKAERDQITTIQSVDQLAEVYESIAEERFQMMAKADQRRITLFGIVMFMMVMFRRYGSHYDLPAHDPEPGFPRQPA